MTIENLKELKRSIRRYYEGPAAVHYLGVMARIDELEASVRVRIDEYEKTAAPIYHEDEETEYWECPFCHIQGGEEEILEHIADRKNRFKNEIAELRRILGAESAGRGVARCGGDSQVGRVRNDFATLAQPPQNKEGGERG